MCLASCVIANARLLDERNVGGQLVAMAARILFSIWM